MSKPIKLLLSLEAVKALYQAAESVTTNDTHGPLDLDEEHTAVLQDVLEVLQSAITKADEDVLIEAVGAVKQLPCSWKKGDPT